MLVLPTATSPPQLAEHCPARNAPHALPPVPFHNPRRHVLRDLHGTHPACMWMGAGGAKGPHTTRRPCLCELSGGQQALAALGLSFGLQVRETGAGCGCIVAACCLVINMRAANDDAHQTSRRTAALAARQAARYVLYAPLCCLEPPSWHRGNTVRLRSY